MVSLVAWLRGNHPYSAIEAECVRLLVLYVDQTQVKA
jgi:hypothetical protein